MNDPFRIYSESLRSLKYAYNERLAIFEYMNEPSVQKDESNGLETSEIVRHDRMVHFGRRFGDL